MASTAEEGDLGHLNVDLVFIGVMKILVPCFFLGNVCGDKMVLPLLFHALFLTGSFLYINSDISVLSSDSAQELLHFPGL